LWPIPDVVVGLIVRIIEIEWSVKNNTEFVPSPKKPKKAKSQKKAKGAFESGQKVDLSCQPSNGEDTQMEVDEEVRVHKRG